MAEYIERTHAIASAVSGRIRALPTTEDGEDWIRVEEVRGSLESIPAADVAPVVHGRWILTDFPDECTYKCSECNEYWVFLDGTPTDNGANYCPNCGARMDLEE